MRRRRLRLVLLGVALFGLVSWVIVSWLVWPTSSAVITAAREKYARLTLGMSAPDVAAILGVPPEKDGEFYGEWVDDRTGRKWYKLTGSPNTRKPKPGERLYDWRAWTFVDGDRSRYQCLHIQVYFDQGRLVAAYYNEAHDTTAKRWLREALPFRSSRVQSFLNVVVDEGRKAIPPP